MHRRTGTVLTAAERIEKKFGGKWSKAGADMVKPAPAVTTGSLLLDEAIGTCKGYPEGSVIEVYGPQHSGKTLMGYLAIAASQRAHPERDHLIIDAENQFKYQAEWAHQLGVDVANLYVRPIGSAEEAFDIIEMAILGDVEFDKDGNIKKVIKPGNFGIIMIDSVTQLCPLEMVHKAMDDGQRLAALASVMSKGLKKTLSAMSITQTQTILFFINQIRSDPGKMFGCMHAGTRIHSVDNRYTMSSFVKNEIEDSVVSYDENKQQFEIVSPKSYFVNGKADPDDFVKIYFETASRSESQIVICTKNHKIMTRNGWKEANALSNDDELLSCCVNPLCSSQKQIFIGSILGDGELRRRNHNTVFKLQNSEQTEYLKWKVDKLVGLKWNGDDRIQVSCEEMFLTNYYSDFYENDFSKEIHELTGCSRRVFNDKIIEELGLLGLAVLYLDNGSLLHSDRENSSMGISFHRLNHLPEHSVVYALSLLVERIKTFGIIAEIKGYGLFFDNVNSAKFSEAICKYVVPEMQYKLHPKDRGKYEDFKTKIDKEYEHYYFRFLKKCGITHKETLCLTKYDIETSNHSYMVGSAIDTPGIIVHNSKEGTTGGNALGFYDTIKYRVAKIKGSEERDSHGKIVAHRAKIRIEKNKAGQIPADPIELKIRYDGVGIDNTFELFNVGVLNEIIFKVKRGKWNFVKPGTDELLFDDIEAFKEADFQEVLEEHPKAKEMIMKFIEDGCFYINDASVEEEREEEEGLKKKNGKTKTEDKEDDE